MPPHEPGALAARFLDVIERDIVPLTRAGVAAGNKLFGAAILKKSDLSLVVAATNAETENPLFHGEVSALNAFYRCRRRLDRTRATACSSPPTSRARCAYLL
jgi:tRNA(Arg) A34 adenosine deaminase TadA